MFQIHEYKNGSIEWYITAAFDGGIFLEMISQFRDIIFYLISG